MPAARKLFPSYGSAVAQAICHALERDGLVRNFVAGYAREFDRKAVAATAAQAHELEATIGREALLAMIIEVREQLPRFFGKRRGAVLAEHEAAAADAFFEQLFSTLGRVECWPEEEMAEFLRDLELYARMSPQNAAAGGGLRGGNAAGKRAAAPDRVQDRHFLRISRCARDRLRSRNDHRSLGRATRQWPDTGPDRPEWLATQ